MKIHPKFATGIFVFCYCGLVILFDKLIKTHFFYKPFFVLTFLIGAELVYIICKKKYDE